MDWIQEAIYTLNSASTVIDRNVEFANHRALNVLRAGEPAAVSAAIDGSTRVDALPTAFALQYRELAVAVSSGLETLRAEVQAAIQADRGDLHALLARARDVAAAPQVFRITRAPTKKGGPQKDPWFTWYKAPVDPGASASMPYRLFPSTLDATDVRETGGADHAAAVSLAALARAAPASLGVLIAHPETAGTWGVTVHLPGKKPIWVNPDLPLHGHHRTRAGVVSCDNENVGVEFIAKAYAMAQADGQLPALDPATSPLTVRVQQSIEALSGNHAFEQPTHLFADDASLLDELRTADLAVACSAEIGPDHPDYLTARRCRLITGREQGYVVLGVDDDDRVGLYHPMGYLTFVATADFRQLFPHIVTGTAPAVPDPVEFTQLQDSHLAAHLQD